MLILSLMSAVNMMPSKGRFQSYLDLLQERYLQRNDDPTEMNGEFVLRNVEVAEDDQEATESLVNRLYNSFMKRDDGMLHNLFCNLLFLMRQCTV